TRLPPRWSRCTVSMTLAIIFLFQAEDGIRDFHVTGVQTCALPILVRASTTTMEKNSRRVPSPQAATAADPNPATSAVASMAETRSEERRVGKEWRGRGSPQE